MIAAAFAKPINGTNANPSIVIAMLTAAIASVPIRPYTKLYVEIPMDHRISLTMTGTLVLSTFRRKSMSRTISSRSRAAAALPVVYVSNSKSPHSTNRAIVMPIALPCTPSLGKPNSPKMRR